MPAGIFINYRRQDALHQARAIYERLRAEFGAGQVFIDLEGLDYGEDFEKALDRQLQDCQVLLALIGPGWLGTKDGHGQRRLDDPDDYVRIELRAALDRDIRVVPVLLDGALLPRREDVPEDLHPLRKRHALALRFDRFDADIGDLVKSLRALLEAPIEQHPPARPTPSPAPRAVPHAPPQFEDTKPLASPAVSPATAPAPPSRHVKTLVSSVPEVGAGSGLASIPPAWRARAGLAAAVASVLLLLAWAANRPTGPATAPGPAPTPSQAAAPAPASPSPVKEVPTPAPKPVAASALAPGTRARDCESDACPWFVVLPPGEFKMGSPASEPGRFQGEGPQHPVKIAYKLAMMETEVTVGQFKAFVAETGHKTEGGCYTDVGNGWKLDPARSWRSPGFEQTDAHAVVCVNWHDARAYADWLGVKAKQAWRLPSEAEWEYAARAGTTTAFAFGNQITTDQANFDGNYTYNGSAKGVYRQKTLPVGQFPANAWKLYDLHGNAWEWVQDCWHDSYQGAPSDGTVWDSACADDRRVLRGGGWVGYPDYARSAYRNWLAQGFRNYGTGFRLARTLTP